MLVDYVDGHLDLGDRARLELHLAECAACRRQLGEERWLSERLHRFATQSPVERLLVWPGTSRQPGIHRRRRALAGVGLATAAVVMLCWRLAPAPPRETIASRTAAAPSVDDEVQFAQIEAAIDREAIAAQLAMSAELLAAEPAAAGYAADSLRFVAETFPDTQAGGDAARRAGLQSPPAQESL